MVSQYGKSSTDMPEVEITPEMLTAGVEAFEAWERFADAPFDGKSTLTQAEMGRLSEEAMILEILRAMFRKVSLAQGGAETASR